MSRPGKLGEFKEELVRALKADAHRPRRNRRTALALFDTIKTNGYAGGYTAVTDFIRGWHESSGHAVTRAFVPLQFEPGEAHQFDWSEEHLMIGGVRKGHCDAEGVPAYVEREFRRYLECGILAHGFARAFCEPCQHDFLIAFSCKGRGVCRAGAAALA